MTRCNSKPTKTPHKEIKKSQCSNPYVPATVMWQINVLSVKFKLEINYHFQHFHHCNLKPKLRCVGTALFSPS